MKTRYSLLLVAAVSACKKDVPSEPTPPVVLSQGSAAATVAADSVVPLAKPSSRKRVGTARSKPVEIAFADPTTKSKMEGALCLGQDVVFVLPSYPNSEWKPTKVDKRLAAPITEFREHWLGSVGGDTFKWSTKALPDDLVTFEFTDVSNGSKVTAVVDVQGCDD